MFMKDVILTIAIILVVILLVVGVLPGRVYVDRHDNLRLQTILGFYSKIPLSEITVSQMPKGAQSGLVRTFGASFAHRNSGKFYNSQLKTSFHLFTTGKTSKTYFEYKGKKYIVDSWE